MYLLSLFVCCTVWGHMVSKTGSGCCTRVLEGAQVCTIDGTGEGRMVVDKKWEHLCVTTGDEPAQPVLLTKRTCKGIDAWRNIKCRSKQWPAGSASGLIWAEISWLPSCCCASGLELVVVGTNNGQWTENKLILKNCFGSLPTYHQAYAYAYMAVQFICVLPVSNNFSFGIKQHLQIYQIPVLSSEKLIYFLSFDNSCSLINTCNRSICEWFNKSEEDEGDQLLPPVVPLHHLQLHLLLLLPHRLYWHPLYCH